MVSSQVTTEPRGEGRAGFVAILGRPNVGKSTFLNRAVGRKVAVVTDKPQTTRSRIVGICQRERSQIVFVDTPGIHKPQHLLNRKMVDLAFAQSLEADAILLMLDALEGLGPGDRFILHKLPEGKPLFLALNKVDRIQKPKLLPLIEKCKALAPWKAIVPISSTKGENVEALLDALEAELPQGPDLYPRDMITEQTQQAATEELVREQVLLRTKQEIPFAATVTVEDWREGESGVLVISANLWVERDSQKGILVGHGGEMIRNIGSDARIGIEELLGRRVYLELRVAVARDWREDPRFLARFFPN